MEKIKFSVDKIDFVEDRSNQFAVFKVYAFASGENAHGMPVSVPTLRRTAYTIYNKPVVWKYQWFTDDAGTHEEDEVPCGFVYKENNPIKFTKLPDGRIMLVINALVWKKYSGRLMEIFKRDDAEKAVSVEIEVYEKKSIGKNKEEIMDLNYTAITILGNRFRPAIPSARAEVLKFAQEKEEYQEVYNEYFESKYNDINFNIPKVVKQNVEKGFELKNKYNVSCSSKILSLARFLQQNDKITSEKVTKFLNYLPSDKSLDTQENEPPTKEYVTTLLCGGEKGITFIKDLYQQMKDENTKLVKYFENEENVASETVMRKEGNIEDMKKTENQAYCDLKAKFDNFLADFKDENETCKYSFADMGQEEQYAIIKDFSSDKYLKVKFEDTEEGFSVYLDNAEEVEFAEDKEDEKEEDKAGKEDMSDEKKEEEEKKEDFADEKKDEEEEKEKEDFAKEEDKEKEKDAEKKDEEDDKATFEEKEEKEEDVEKKYAEKFSILEAEIATLKNENESLKSQNTTLIQFQNEVNAERKNFEVEKTLKEISDKCPNMSANIINDLRAKAINYSINDLDAWKNSVKAEAWNFTTTSETIKSDVVKIGLEFTNNVQSNKNTLWT